MALMRDWSKPDKREPPDERWGKTENIEAACALLGTAVNRHPLLVLLALRRMLLQGLPGNTTAPHYRALAAHIGHTCEGIGVRYDVPAERQHHEQLTRMAAALRQAPPFVPPIEGDAK